MNFDYKFSFIFPIHNEEKILKKQLLFFVNFLKKINIDDYEIILLENGSHDNSLKLISNLSKKYSKFRFYHLPQASYGLAIKNAMLLARGKYLVILDLDFFNLDILQQGLKLVDQYQLIVASKSLNKNLDKRPFKDKLRTRFFNLLIQFIFKYPGSDTHGNKIIKNSLLLKKNIYRCFSKYEFFDTELMLRLMKTKKFRLKEFAVVTKEIRSSRYSSFRRYKLCLLDLIRIMSCFIFRDIKFEAKTIKNFEINADDYGNNQNIDQIILDQKSALSLTRISILTNLLSRESLKNLKKFTKTVNCDLNLHFNLLRGKPISLKKDVPSLVDKNGCFFSLPIFLLKMIFSKINFDEVKLELNKQLTFFKKNKIKCVGIDSEQHLHIFVPIWSIVKEFANQNNLQVRSQNSTFYHLKKHPIKYLFCYFTNFMVFKKKRLNGINHYDAIIVHPGTNYD